MPAVPWRRIVALAVAATAVGAALVLLNLRAVGQPVAGLLYAGADGPSADVVVADLGGPLEPGVGHDGQQFYAVARNPLDPHEAAESLERPRYRLQRPGFSLLAWALHPSGGGEGLVWALFAVGVAGLALGGVALGGLAARTGGTPLLAAAFPLLPGSLLCLRLTLADPLALAFALSALALDLAGRRRAAVVLGVAAVLTKESTLLVLLGWALARPSDRGRQRLVIVPALAGGALAALLWAVFPGQGLGVGELGPPLLGILASVPTWAAGDHLTSLCSLLAAVALGVAALRRHGLRSPFGPAVALQLAFLTLVTDTVWALGSGGLRVTLPALALGVLALLAAPAERPVPALVAA